MRRHGWSGDLPASDDEAVRRILDATRSCIDRGGADVGIAEVARELGVTRQTVYRYFRTTEDLLTATALDGSAAFLDRVEAHLRGRAPTPEEAVVEAVAFTLEQLPREPYVGLLLAPGRVSLFSRGITSEVAIALGRSIVERFPVDWGSHGYTDADLDELVEQMLRMSQSLVVDPGNPPRTGEQLRAYLRRWLGTAVPQRFAPTDQPARRPGSVRRPWPGD